MRRLLSNASRRFGPASTRCLSGLCVADQARGVLEAGQVEEKSRLATQLSADLAAAVASGEELVLGPASAELPDHPARPPRPVLVSGSKFKRPDAPLNVYLLHALAHVELNAVDLYADTIARFCGRVDAPAEAFVDMASIAADEARHFGMLRDRLQALGFDYGDLPAHRALWDHAIRTAGQWRARLVAIPLVQEARALDSGDRLCAKMLSMGDVESEAVVRQIVEEEVDHVRRGLRWFQHSCETGSEVPGFRGEAVKPIEEFHSLVREFIPSPLPEPFNEAQRQLAGMSPAYYKPVGRGALSHDDLQEWRKRHTRGD